MMDFVHQLGFSEIPNFSWNVRKFHGFHGSLNHQADEICPTSPGIPTISRLSGAGMTWDTSIESLPPNTQPPQIRNT